jgi:hypothetical protein
MIASIAEAEIVPAPIKAIAFLGKCLPAIDNTRKPINGKTGITNRN